MRASIISLGLYKHTGGPTKTIGQFKRALDAELFAFCASKEASQHPLAIEGAVVKSSSLPILSSLCYSSAESTRFAEASVAESDIISCHMFYRYHVQWTRCMSKKYGVPYWFVPHGVFDPWVLTYGKLQKKLFWKFGGRRFLDEASTVIFATRAERDKAQSQFELPDADVISWPVDLVDLTDRETKRAQIRISLGIPEEAHVLLYFGRLHPMKRPLETIEALAKANAPQTHLIIVGNEFGVTESDCRQLARNLGVGERVHFVGPVYGEAKYDYMHAADAYISLSHRENFNHTAAESLAAGLPVILSPGNDLLSEIEGIDCAWALQDDRMQTAVEAIGGFSESSASLIKGMGANGRTWVADALSYGLFRARLQALSLRHRRK